MARRPPPPRQLTETYPAGEGAGDPESSSSPLAFDSLTLADIDALEKLRPDLRKELSYFRRLLAERLALEADIERSSLANDPVRFVDREIGLVPTEAARRLGYRHGITPQQIQILEAIRDHKFVAIPAGHGLGKTACIALAVLWFLCTRRNAFILTTAPTWTLVEEQLWREIRRFHSVARVPLPGKPLTTKWELGEKWFAIGLSTNDGGRFRGFHSDHNMVIFDQATEIDPAFYPEAMSMVLNEHDRFVLIGNPTDPSSHFKECCDNPLWHTIVLDSRDHPNVVHKNPRIVPGAVTHTWVAEQLEAAGGDQESPLFKSRVRGVWPIQSSDTLIPLPHIVRAQGWDARKRKSAEAALEDAVSASQGPILKLPRTSILSKRGVALGLDVAGLGQDLATLFAIEDSRARLLWWSRQTEPMTMLGRLVGTINDLDGRAAILCLDDTGIGQVISSRLYELQRWTSGAGVERDEDGNALLSEEAEKARLAGDKNSALLACKVVRVNFGANALRPELYYDAKSEMWWETREALRKGILGLPPELELKSFQPAIPKDSDFIRQVSSPIYEQASGGVIRVYDKRLSTTGASANTHAKTKFLPTKSPDLAHGLILAVHAWLMLRPELSVSKATTPLEAAQEKFAKIIREKKHPKHKADREDLGGGDFDYLNAVSGDGWRLD